MSDNRQTKVEDSSSLFVVLYWKAGRLSILLVRVSKNLDD